MILNTILKKFCIYDLYIGYPFNSGSILDGTYIRAPLFLYPVKLERVKTHGMMWTLEPIIKWLVSVPLTKRPTFK